MPWTTSQHRLFQAAAHNPQIAQKTGIPQAQAAKMSAEAVKRKSLANALRTKR